MSPVALVRPGFLAGIDCPCQRRELCSQLFVLGDEFRDEVVGDGEFVQQLAETVGAAEAGWVDDWEPATVGAWQPGSTISGLSSP